MASKMNGHGMRRVTARKGPRRAFAASWLGFASLLFSVPALAQFDGLWKGRFGGVALEVTGQDIELVQVSESFSWPLDRFRIDETGAFATSDGRRYQFALREDRLEILDDRQQVFLSFVPTDALPAGIAPTGDAGVVFDVFWESFAENHALFDLTGVDWMAQREAGRSAALDAETPGELFDAMAALLVPLNDRHTTLVRPEARQIYRSGPESDPFWQGRANEFLANIATSYLGRPLQSRLADPRFRFGILADDIGYLYVDDFLNGGGLPKYTSTLALVLDELKDTRGLIVDLRFNPGGVDENSFAFMERLWPPSRTEAWYRERRLTGPLPATYDSVELQRISPLENDFYRQPIVFLTGHDTASAAETVLLAALGLPRVVQVGEPSAGVFSNLLIRTYPNGWYSTLSNEQFYSLNGDSYEQKGVPPHVSVDQSDYDLAAGVDAALDAAIAVIDAQPTHIESTVSPARSASGLWYDPVRDGEGWHVQRIDDERVFVTFYGYDPDGSGKQDWLVGLGVEKDGVLRLEELVTATAGASMNDDSAPTIDIVPWGEGEIRFADCDNAVAELTGPDAHRGFVFRLERLTRVPGLGCAAQGSVDRPDLAGSWYDPARAGEGWLLTPIGERAWSVSWYTVDDEGARRWWIGTGNQGDDGSLLFPELVEGLGADWGHDFEPGDVERRPYGSLSVTLEGCDGASMMHDPGEGTTRTVSTRRLTRVAGLGSEEPCS